MTVEVVVPSEFQGIVVNGLNKRSAVITSTDSSDDYFTVYAEVPLNEMFGYASSLRASTQV